MTHIYFTSLSLSWLSALLSELLPHLHPHPLTLAWPPSRTCSMALMQAGIRRNSWISRRFSVDIGARFVYSGRRINRSKFARTSDSTASCVPFVTGHPLTLYWYSAAWILHSKNTCIELLVFGDIEPTEWFFSPDPLNLARLIRTRPVTRPEHIQIN